MDEKTMVEHAHISHAFDTELATLRERVLAMGALVGSNVEAAAQAFLERDPARATAVIERDREVNRLELGIDEECIGLLALRQPAAGDLRLVAATLKIVVDLERIGDLAVNMAERVIPLCEEPPLDLPLELGAMCALAQQMLKDALDAFVRGDVAEAERILRADNEVDRLLARQYGVLVEAMKADPGQVSRALGLLLFAKHVERAADHITNVAEMVIYLVRGEDVRHRQRR
jgi:phosphate transport system protein